MESQGATSYLQGSILDVLGWKRLCAVVWYATPFPWRLIGFPYGVLVYRRLLAASDTLRYLQALHAKEFDSSLLFRLLRPRYRKVAHLLRGYGFVDHKIDQQRK
jgi:hypothetical protein